jgi:dsRNA-specific ribonuclease
MDSQTLQQTLRFQFTDAALMEEALRHSSYVNEQADAGLRDNERLEFLGDAVLNLVIGDLLMKAYPQMREGDLSRIRANMVNEAQLADVARSLDLGTHLLLGKGELQSNGWDKNSLLANAMEAMIAAIYLDGGFQGAFRSLPSTSIL